MKIVVGTLGLLAFANAVAAQAACASLTTKFPPCAYTCISSAANAVGCTDTANLGCQCTPASSMAIQSKAIGCVLACGGDAAGSALDAASSICHCVATATVPSSTSVTMTSETKTTQTTTETKTSDTGSMPGSTTSMPASTSTSAGTQTTTMTTSACVPGTKPDCKSVGMTAVPTCAQACFMSGAKQVNCDATDYACQCQPAAQKSLSTLLLPCLATACDAAALPSVIAGASSVCACALATPTGGDCSGTGTGTTTTPTTTETETDNCPTGTEETETETETQVSTITSCPGGCPPGNSGSTGGETQPTGGNGGTQPPGGSGATTGGSGATETTGAPPPITAGGATYEVGLVAGLVGAFWVAAVAL